MANSYLTVNRFSGLDEGNIYGENYSLSPDMNNFKVCSDGSLKKREGIRLLNTSLNGSVYIMWSGYLNNKSEWFVCAGNKVYKYNFSSNEFEAISIMAGRCKHIFPFGNTLFFLCNSGYFKYENGIYTQCNPYIPLVAVSCLPDGSGTVFESVNLLTGKKRQQFSSDGRSTVYSLAEKQIDRVISVMASGTSVSNWTADTVNGKVTFTDGYVPPEGINNIEICWEKASTAKPQLIHNCTHSMNFGGNTDTRVFLYGHPDYPNYRFFSALANGLPSAEYFPENNYTVIGSSTITDMVQQYDRQLIFTEDRAYYSYCELRTDSLGNYYPSFPVYNLNFEKGNLIHAACCVIDNMPVSLCADGLNKWISTTVQDERNAVCFSRQLKDTVSRIINFGRGKECILFDRKAWKQLFFSTPYGLYIYRYDMDVWYKYDSLDATAFCEIDGTVYWLTSDGMIYFYSTDATDDQGRIISAYWVSPMGKFGTTSRRFDLSGISFTADNTQGTELAVVAEPSGDGQLMNFQSISENGSDREFLKTYKIRTEVKRVYGGKVTLSTGHRTRQANIKTITFKTKKKEEFR